MAKNSNSAGIPLSTAWRKLASRRLKNTLRDVENYRPPKTQANDPGPPLKFWGRALEVLGEVAEFHSSKSATISKMRGDLRRGLIAGRFRAFGYRTKPKIQDILCHIPAYVFQGEIDWEVNSVTHDGRKYEGIIIQQSSKPTARVPDAFIDQSAASDVNQSEILRPGPKPIAPLIIQTHEILEARGDLLKCKTKKDRWRKVVSEIEKTNKGEKIRGLTYPSFCRHIKN